MIDISLCIDSVTRDRVDAVNDEKLADFVVSTHIKSHPSNAPDDDNAADVVGADADDAENSLGLSQEQLRKYIMFTKQQSRPKLDNIDREKIAQFYSDLRQKSMSSPGGIICLQLPL